MCLVGEHNYNTCYLQLQKYMFKFQKVQRGHDYHWSTVNEGESRNHQQKFSRDIPLASVLLGSFTIQNQAKVVYMNTQNRLVLLAFMTLKPFHLQSQVTISTS